MTRILGLSFSIVIALGLVAMTVAQRAQPAQAAVPVRLQPTPAPPPRVELPRVSPFRELASLYFWSLNQHRGLDVRLYDESGHVDEKTALELDALLGDARPLKHGGKVEVRKIERRTLQLVVKAAYHFKSTRVEIVSGYRNPRRRHENQHGRGAAIDFKLEGVSAKDLAAYLRTQAHVGVGVYTHPRTQFVHVDSRERSFHWTDASPPGGRKRERALNPELAPENDPNYLRAHDWPEGLEAPVDELAVAVAFPLKDSREGGSRE